MLWPLINVLLSLVAVCMEMMFVVHGVLVEDYSFATECFSYVILLGVIPPIYGSIVYHQSSLLELIHNMNEDFKFICNIGAKYRNQFLQRQLLIWKLCFAWLLFTSFIAVSFLSMAIVPLIYLSLLAEQNEHTVRPLIFPMWLPKDDPYRTPNYEIFFFLQMNFCFMYIQSFVVYVYLQFHVMLHNISILEVIVMHLEALFDGLDESAALLQRDHPLRVAVQHTLKQRIGRIVRFHNSVFTSIASLSSIQGAPLMYQVIFSAIAICVMFYQVVDKLDNNKFDILFTMLVLGACTQLWIPCYLGTMLRNKAFAVGDACWNSGWYETSLGKLVCADIVIIILRSQMPLSIKFIGLPNLSLETFSSVISTAYSYFNMLRQYSNLN